MSCSSSSPRLSKLRGGSATPSLNPNDLNSQRETQPPLPNSWMTSATHGTLRDPFHYLQYLSELMGDLPKPFTTKWPGWVSESTVPATKQRTSGVNNNLNEPSRNQEELGRPARGQVSPSSIQRYPSWAAESPGEALTRETNETPRDTVGFQMGHIL